MEGLFSLLMFAALFYFMMRFGCGAHIVHGRGGHGDHREHGKVEGNARDPVCGMDVNAGQGYTKVHQGCQYRFCSRECLEGFELEPQRYIRAEAQ